MNKAKELLKELQDLDMDIQSRIDEINELEAGLLSSPKWTDVKVQGRTELEKLMTSILSLS